MMDNFVRFSAAHLSDCLRYRYVLWREWAHGEGYVNFIGLNPSTADHIEDDATIRRCLAFAKGWGFRGLIMTNLFAYRARDPVVMRAAQDPIGPDNDQALLKEAARSDVVVAAWSVQGKHLGRDAAVRALIPNLHVLRLTTKGHPSHPLYQPKTLKLEPWSNQEGPNR